MGENGSLIVTLFFGLIAVGILLRLYGELGRRTGEERSYGPAFKPDHDAAPTVAQARRAAQPAPGEVRSLNQMLAEVAAIDPNFDEGQFLAGAKAAFQQIVMAYAQGERALLRPLLAPTVAADFEASITAREANGETLEAEITRIQQPEITASNLDGTLATITVRFVSEQIMILRNASGEILDGKPGKAVEIEDIWQFSRELLSDDLNWQLTATRAPA